MNEESLIDSIEERSCAEPPYERDSYESEWNVTGQLEDDSSRTPMQQLEWFFDEYGYSQSQRPLDRPKDLALVFRNVVITRPMITLLRPLLLGDDVSSSVQDDDNDNVDTLPCTTSNIQQPIFSIISVIQSSRFFSQADATTPDQDDDVCTPDDKVCFLSALTRCSGDLIIYDCPDIVSELLNNPEIDQLEAETLSLEHTTPLTDLEYVRLGAIIENSIKLTGLGLTMYPGDVPQAFCDSFANYVHIQWLLIRQTTNDRTDRNTFWSKMIANDGNGPLERQLRNPQSQLNELSLRSSNLEDHHLMVLAELLPFTHIKRIDVQENNITAPGLLEFARQLPKMHSLAQIELEWNPWEESSPEVLEKCGAALLHGLIDNPSIQSLDCADSLPQWLLLWHYLSLNCAGRKLLTSSSYGKQPSIPDGLWPRVLSRAGRPNEQGGRSEIQEFHDGMEYKYSGPANAMYFFLRNCPEILSWKEKSITSSKGLAGVKGKA